MPENRRVATRHPVSLAATVTVAGTPSQTTLLNLSLGGAFLALARRPMGERVKLRFSVPTQEEAIETEATVRWSTDEGVGVQFDGLRARDVWALSKYIEQLPSSP